MIESRVFFVEFISFSILDFMSMYVFKKSY